MPASAPMSSSSYRLAEDGTVLPIKNAVRQKMDETAKSKSGVEWGPTATFDVDDENSTGEGLTKTQADKSAFEKPPFEGSLPELLEKIPVWALPAVVLLATFLCVLIPVILMAKAAGSGGENNGSKQDGDITRSAISVAFVGNANQYYNDLPRFMEVLSGDLITQDSCLHDEATIANLLDTGNGMYTKFNTDEAAIADNEGLYDYGACTVRQLIFGKDRYIYHNWMYLNESSITDDYIGVYSDGSNPCYEDPDYLQYKSTYLRSNIPDWNYVLLNDEAVSPGESTARALSLTSLKSSYVNWFIKTSAIPVFLHTPAYWSDLTNMTGLVDVPTFTSVTYEGYRQYKSMLGKHLPSAQQPLIAPVGVAYLTVWEEDYTMWEKLFHYDEVHPSPHGTYLQGLIVHHTLFGMLPPVADALPSEISSLFARARRMQPPTHQRKSMPSYDDAVYLYNVAERVAAQGYVPDSFVTYSNGESFETLDD